MITANVLKTFQKRAKRKWWAKLFSIQICLQFHLCYYRRGIMDIKFVYFIKHIKLFTRNYHYLVCILYLKHNFKYYLLMKKEFITLYIKVSPHLLHTCGKSLAAFEKFSM